MRPQQVKEQKPRGFVWWFYCVIGNISNDIEVTDNYPFVHIDTDDKEKMKAIKLFVEFWEKIQTEE